MSHVKSSGSVNQHAQGKRKGKRLGVKKFGGQVIKPGQIILRQRGAKYKSGAGAGMGRDHTIFALIQGTVTFGQKFGRTLVKVVAN